MSAINATRAVERCERLADLGPPPPWSRPWKLKRWLRAYRAIMALDISECAEMLREVYTPARIAEMAEQQNAWLGFVKRSQDAARPRFVEPVSYDKPSYWPSKGDDDA